MGFMERLPPRLQQRVKAELVKRYHGNSVDYAINVEGSRRIKEAQRHARGGAFDQGLRRAYSRNWCSTMEDVALEPSLFDSIRARSVAALDDPVLSPCCYNSGTQCELQGVPREVIK